MSDIPLPETNDPRELDAGELFRPSPRHLPVAPLKPMNPRNRKVLLGVLGAVAAIAVAVVSLAR